MHARPAFWSAFVQIGNEKPVQIQPPVTWVKKRRFVAAHSLDCIEAILDTKKEIRK